MTVREPATGTQSVERALSLLTAFTDESPEMRISELVLATGLGQSTVSRLVSTLTSLGYLRQDERRSLYGLGTEPLRLANLALNSSNVHQRSRQIAQLLACETGLGVNVAERHGDQLVYLCNFEGAAVARSATLVGRSAPLHATALGKVLLAALSDIDVDALVGKRLKKFTTHTITDTSSLISHVAQVRDSGYALEIEEAAPGRACVAAPIRGRSGAVVAAISISGPISAMRLPEREAELSATVLHTAGDISGDLGYVGDFAP
jgi:DNA-binding IclR family transcriptional regulator